MLKYGKLVLISGKKESGKDTIGDYISRLFHALIPKKLGFAISLKEFTHNWFDTPLNVLYGTGEEKDGFITKIKKNNKFLTARELLQVTGDALRSIDPDIFVNKTLKEIENDCGFFYIITDCRFMNEIDLVKKFCCKNCIDLLTIRLTRSVKQDGHISENDLDGFIDKFDIIIDNQNQTLDETFDNLLMELRRVGWIT